MLTLLLGAVCLWAVAMVVFRSNPLVNHPLHTALVGGTLAAMTVVAVATSDSEVDRPLYLQQFLVLDQAETPWDVPGLLQNDRAFNLLLWSLARVAPATEVVLYSTVSALIVAGYLLSSRMLLPPWAALASFLTVLATGLLTAYASVAIRQGLALACLLVAVSIYASGRRRRWWFWALLLCAGLFHWSAVPLAVGLLVLSWRTPPFRLIVLGWLVLAAAFVAGVPERLFGGLTYRYAALDLYTSTASYQQYASAGPRLDFLAISGVILAVAVWGRRFLPADDQVHHRLTAAFVLLNSAFLLLGFVAFSDRLASYSWFLAPALLWYPLAKRDTAGAVTLSTLALLSVIGAGVAIGTATQLA